MEFRYFARTHRGTTAEPKTNGRSHQSLEIYSSVDVFFPPIQSSILRHEKNSRELMIDLADLIPSQSDC